MQLSDKILRLRKSKGMSQDELAQQINVSRQAVSRWETGSAKPDADNIAYELNPDRDHSAGILPECRHAAISDRRRAYRRSSDPGNQINSVIGVFRMDVL